MAPTRKECPCKVNGIDCPRRSISPNCHETCPDYKEYVEWNEFYNSLRNQYKDADQAMVESRRRQSKAKRSDKKFKEFGHKKY